VTIRGPGRIYGRGLSRGNGRIALPVGQVAPQPPGHLPDVLEADGPFEPFPTPLVPGPFGYPHAKDTLPAGVGNKAIALRACRQVTIRDLTILHGGHFAILAAACDNVVIDGVFIDTNRDGIDIDACANVRIAHCSVNSPWDDGICIKSSCGFGGLRPVENVTVSDCYVSGFTEGTLYDGTRERVIRHRGGPIGRIKLGTEASGGFRNIAITNCIFEFCRGLALEQVDGAPMEDVVVSNLTLREVMNAPIFIRLGARLRAPGAAAPGTATRIAISNVIAHDVAPEHGIFIAGLPGHPVTDVRLAGIQLHCRGGGTREEAARLVPELPAGYPEPMLFGPLPAWGLYARHAARIQVRDLTLHLLAPDQRPAIMLDDVAAADLAGIRGTGAGDWNITAGSTLRACDCDGLPDGRR
jgi:polygalacturonase